MIIEVIDKKKIKDLFNGWQESLLYSCLQDHMGKAYATNAYKSAMIVVDVFCFFAGKVSNELIEYHRYNFKGFYILTFRDDAWKRIVKQTYENYKVSKRYAIKKEDNVFDETHLLHCIQNIPAEYTLEMIGDTHYQQIMQERWSKDLCSLFKDEKDFKVHGLGVVALKGETIVSGASSYAYYGEGIEIEIDTHKEYRRNGLALACGAKLILECLKRGLYPSWDAQNLGSVALAEKLGYHFDHDYDVYEVCI